VEKPGQQMFSLDELKSAEYFDALVATTGSVF
jgi:hypothetical protein